jgi:hypothetical protein
MNYLIEYNNKIIGVYNTFSDAELFILGNLQNNLFNHNVKILTFRSNSCYCSEIKNYYEIDSKNNNINEIDSNENENNINLKYELKAKLQHEKNLLNNKQKKLNEKKNIYENDLKLFQIFKDESIDDIPKLFLDKFKIINKLLINNNLNIDSYFNLLDELELKSINSLSEPFNEIELKSINSLSEHFNDIELKSINSLSEPLNEIELESIKSLNKIELESIKSLDKIEANTANIYEQFEIDSNK